MAYNKVHIMPIAIQLQHPAIMLESQRVQEMIGFLRWITKEWDKEEYENVRNKVTSALPMYGGKEIGELVEGLANRVAQIIPGQAFSINIGSFGIEYKVEAEEKED